MRAKDAAAMPLTLEEHRQGEAWLLLRVSSMLSPSQLQQLPGLSGKTEAEISSLRGFPEPSGQMRGGALFHVDDVLAWWRTLRSQTPE